MSSQDLNMKEETIDMDHNSNGKKKPLAAIATGAKKIGAAGHSVFQDFANFIARGNVIDLAVGIVMGAAFTAIVTSFVQDLITPVIGLAVQKNLNNAFLVISCANATGAGCVTGVNHPYPTVKQANEAGAVTWNWGNFVQAVLNFIIISTIVFMIVKVYAAIFLRKKPAPATKTCQVCFEDCKIKALKCKHCLSDFPAPEPQPEPAPQEHRGVFSIPNIPNMLRR
ncbi:hypothetical protein HDV05_006661 [Chytridiales sp. JEL 0842]|nr:hypothetical protein HDV05_006661 [Chytridiales sp. JEL 0842]